MTRRTVIWIPSAEADLTEIWLRSDSRDLITSASHSIDSALGKGAESAGTPLAEGLLAFEAPPLRVLFEILDDDSVVRILKVRQISPEA